MELEVGMYVRTNCRHEVVIRQIKAMYHSKEAEDTRLIFDKPTKYEYYVEDEKFKASNNPIDLIEVGDYVNGLEVVAISKFKDGSRYIEFDEGRFICKNYQIESIVTKEQFDSMKYEI